MSLLEGLLSHEVMEYLFHMLTSDISGESFAYN